MFEFAAAAFVYAQSGQCTGVGRLTPGARAVLHKQTDRLSALPGPVRRAPALPHHFKAGRGRQECQVHHQEMMRDLEEGEEEAHLRPLYVHTPP